MLRTFKLFSHFFQGTSSEWLHTIHPDTYNSPQPIPDPCLMQSMSNDPSNSMPVPPVPPPKPPVQSTSNGPATSVPEQHLPPRNQRLPARFQDLLLDPPLPAVAQPPSSSGSILPRVFLHVFDSFRMQFNRFGIAHAYHHRPSHDPESFLFAEELSQTNKSIHTSAGEGMHVDYPPPWPWPNMTIWQLMRWKESRSAHKSDSEVTRLVHDVL